MDCLASSAWRGSTPITRVPAPNPDAASTTYRYQDNVQLLDLLQQLEGRRALTGYHHGVVIRMDHVSAGGFDHPGQCILPGPHTRLAVHHLGLVMTHSRPFYLG